MRRGWIVLFVLGLVLWSVSWGETAEKVNKVPKQQDVEPQAQKEPKRLSVDFSSLGSPIGQAYMSSKQPLPSMPVKDNTPTLFSTGDMGRIILYLNYNAPSATASVSAQMMQCDGVPQLQCHLRSARRCSGSS
jgi:hypothetical protein